MANFELPFGVRVVKAKPVDAWYDNDGTPYVDIAAAVAAVPLSVRYRGLTVNINGTEYWWQTTLNANPVLKSSGDLSHTHVQGTPSATWNVTHNLGKNPTVAVVDSLENEVIGDIQYVDSNNLTITFTSTFSGKAYCN